MINWFLEVTFFSFFVSGCQGAARAGCSAGKQSWGQGQCKAGTAATSLTAGIKARWADWVRGSPGPGSTSKSSGGPSQARKPSPQVQIRETWEWMQTYLWWRRDDSDKDKVQDFQFRRIPQARRGHLQTVPPALSFQATGYPLSSHPSPR